MPTTKKSAFIGLTGGLTGASVSDSVEMVELQNGLAKFNHPKELTQTVSKDKTFGDAFGIMSSGCALNNFLDADGVIFESVTQTLTDEVSDRQLVANSTIATPTGFVAPDGSKFLLTTANMIWTGFTETISMQIKYTGALTSSFLRPGFRIFQPFVVTPAVVSAGLTVAAITAVNAISDIQSDIPHGYAPFVVFNPTSPITFEKHMVVTSVEKTQSSEEWHTASIEMSRFVPVGDGCAEDLVATGVSPLQDKLQLLRDVTNNNWLPIGGSSGEYMPASADLSAFYSVTITTSLTAGSNPTLTESVEFFPDDETADFIDTGYDGVTNF